MHFSVISIPTAAFSLVLIAGCASYPHRTRDAYADFQNGHLLEAVNSYADTDLTQSEFLSGAEAGSAAFAAGDWSGARQQFQRAVDAVDELEQRAAVSLEGATEVLASWALNDTTQEYFGEGFERVYVHANLALIYLAMGRLEDLWVETRLANKLLEREEELYETKYAAGGLGHFLSALSFEMSGRLDEAIIDYRRMEEKGVGTLLVGRALVRLSKELGYDSEYEALEEAYGPDYERPRDAASIVVIGGVGLGPTKHENSLAIPTHDGFYTLAVPEYIDSQDNSTGLELSVGSHTMKTVVLENVNEVARANLSDRLLWISAKSAARGLLKLGVTRELEDNAGSAGFIIGSLYALISERADLRAWQTLPYTWEAGRVFVESGVHTLKLKSTTGESVALGTFELLPGETMIVLARSVGNSLYAYPIGGLMLSDSTELNQSIQTGEIGIQ